MQKTENEIYEDLLRMSKDDKYKDAIYKYSVENYSQIDIIIQKIKVIKDNLLNDLNNTPDKSKELEELRKEVNELRKKKIEIKELENNSKLDTNKKIITRINSAINECEIGEDIDISENKKTIKIKAKERKKLSKNKYEYKKYIFNVDYVSKGESNLEVSDKFKVFINKFLNNNDSLILGYGETGSGKTYSFFGNQLVKGIVYYLTDYLIKQNNNNNIYYKIYEIYFKGYFDLLNKNSYYKQNIDDITSFTEKKLDIIQNFNNYLEEALKLREIGKTNLNKGSSRSVLIVEFIIKENNKKFIFIDPFGNEAGSTYNELITNEKEKEKEHIFISDSLYFLNTLLREYGNKKKDKKNDKDKEVQLNVIKKRNYFSQFILNYLNFKNSTFLLGILATLRSDMLQRAAITLGNIYPEKYGK